MPWCFSGVVGSDKVNVCTDDLCFNNWLVTEVSVNVMAAPPTIETVGWRLHCDHIIERLKSAEVFQERLTDDELQASKFLPIELHGAIHRKDVSKFVRVLERIAATDHLSVIVEKASSCAGNTILHIAANFGSENILELIAHHFPQLITRRNIKGDRVLHVAAKTHNSLLIKIVIQCYARHSANSFSTHNNEDKLTRMRNEYGNTALHEAVIAGNVDGAELLFTVDEVVTYFLNKEGKSPLYLAVETGNDKIVEILLQTQLPNMEMHQGNSPLHAAILARISGQRIKSIFFSQPLLEGWLLDRESGHTTPCMDKQIPHEVSYQIKKMIGKKRDLINWRDQKGGTPLHCAASVGYLDGVRIIVRVSPLSTLEWNMKGQLPIHIACKNGHINVVKELVQQQSFDPMDSLNYKCQTILHIAAKSGRDNVVKYILREKKLENLLNEKDNNGNSPLHLASQYQHPKVLLLLTQEKRLNMKLVNNEGLTARDVVLLQRNTPPTFRELLSFAILKSSGTPLSEEGIRIRRSQATPQVKWIKDRVSTIILVAILVATVTFAAGFTMPGGVYSPDNTNTEIRGLATLLDRKMFQLFTICDAIAMYSSTMGYFILLWAQLGDFHVAFRATYFALYLVGLALVTMSIAFMAGLHLVVSNLSWLADTVLVLGITFILTFLAAYILLIFPLGARHHLLPPYFSKIILKMIISFSGSSGKLRKG